MTPAQSAARHRGIDMGRQTDAIAYGHPDKGGIVIGGRNNTAYTLGDDWVDSSDGERLSVTTTFWVHGDATVSIDDRVAALAALEYASGNLGITGADSVGRECDLTQDSDKLVLTLTTGVFFTAADVGLPIHITGVGSFQITEWVSDYVVKCRIPSPLSVPSPATDKACWIGAIFRRARNQPIVRQ